MDSTATVSERIVEVDAIEALPAIVQRLALPKNLLLVCDDATWVAAGQQAQMLLAPHFDVMAHSLGRAPKALLQHVQPILISARAQGVGAIVAIGSGTVNDVAKYAAHALGCDYICVATAASMNGYSSATASLEENGHKQSHVAQVPRAVIADLRVIAAAPKRLARAGLGDTLCRSTVAADCYLSHVVKGTPFERQLFDQLRAHEAWLIGHASLLKEGAVEYMRHLMHALLDAGDAMTRVQSSAIASQGEHMIAHTLEMLYSGEVRDLLHGELIAVTTSSMAHMQHKIMLGQPQLRHLPREDTVFTRTFGKQLGSKLAQIYARKVIAEPDIAAANAQFTRHWPDIKAEMVELIVPANGVERAYVEAGLATKPQGLNLTQERYDAAVGYAYLTRERFTFLDLAAMNARRA